MADKRAYFKVDVGYFDNPKVADLVDDNPRAVLLHLRAIAYCAQHLTDGVFPMRLVMRLACGSHSDLQWLVDRGLVMRLDDVNGLIHDYLEHQRSAESVKKAKVAGQAGAVARWDANRNADGNADRIADGNAAPNADPNAEKERKRERDTSDAAEPRADVLDICDALSEALTHNGVKHTIGKRWHTAARLILDSDGRPFDEVIEVIDYATTDDFWKPNILSMPKLRAKYDTLRLQMQRPVSSGNRQDDVLRREWARVNAEQPVSPWDRWDTSRAIGQ